MGVGLAPTVHEGRRGVRWRACPQHGARPLPLVDLSRLEKGYPKEVGPQEADELRAGLLDLSSTVIGDINLCGMATPPDQLGSDRSARELSGTSLAEDGRLTPAVSTSQAPVAPTPSSGQQGQAGDQPEQ